MQSDKEWAKIGLGLTLSGSNKNAGNQLQSINNASNKMSFHVPINRKLPKEMGIINE